MRLIHRFAALVALTLSLAAPAAAQDRTKDAQTLFRATPKNHALVIEGSFHAFDTSYVIRQAQYWQRGTGRQDLMVVLGDLSGDEDDVRLLGVALATLGYEGDGVMFEYSKTCGRACAIVMDARVGTGKVATIDDLIADHQKRFAVVARFGDPYLNEFDEAGRR